MTQASVQMCHHSNLCCTIPLNDLSNSTYWLIHAKDWCLTWTQELGVILYYMHCMFNHGHRSCFIWKEWKNINYFPWLDVVFTHEARIEASPCRYISIVKIGVFTENKIRCMSYSGLIFHDCTTYLVLTRPDFLRMTPQCAPNICMRYICIKVRQLRFLGSVHIADIKWLPRQSWIYNLYNFTVLLEMIYPFYILQETKRPIYALRNTPCPQNTNLKNIYININGLNYPQIWIFLYLCGGHLEFV